MNLIIDIGNSRGKVALTQSGEVVWEKSYDAVTKSEIAAISTENREISAAILASTRKPDQELKTYLKSRFESCIIFDHTTPIPLKNLYKTPETLGHDRLASAIGAWSLMPDEELLIFDFGTALTIDRVTKNGEYLGGNISPGLAMRFEALAHFTQRLPLVVHKEHHHNDIEFGTTTHEAIWCGVVRGLEHEVQGYIGSYRGAKLFFTGRDAKHFAKCGENTIFADPLLVIKGLERIIQYNAK